MTKFTAIILFLILFPQFGFCDWNCEILTGQNQSKLELGEATLRNHNIPESMNITDLKILECTCDSETQVI